MAPDVFSVVLGLIARTDGQEEHWARPGQLSGQEKS